MTLLNLAEICPASHTLGPGQRFVIWVQGCCFNCPSCVSPDWIPQREATLLEPQRLLELILAVPGTEGVTISGGEPMLQATALKELLIPLRQNQDLSLICYSGFTLQQLHEQNDPDIEAVLSQLDILIDGQYIEQLNDNQGWRGSSNQVIHHFTSRHLAEAELFSERQRHVEIHLRKKSALMVGVPPNNFVEVFDQSV